MYRGESAIYTAGVLLHSCHSCEILGRRYEARDIQAGTPLGWDIGDMR